MSGIVFPDFIGTMGRVSAMENAQAQRDWMDEDRAAKKSVGPYVQKALQGDQGALGEIATRHPDTYLKIAPLLERMDAGKRAKVKEDADFITQSGMAILNAPPEQQPQLYARVRQEAQAKGRDVSQWPTQYDPGWVKFNVDKAMPFAEHFKRSGEGVQFAAPQGGSPVPGGPGPVAPKEWDPHFNSASQQYNVPVPLIKAVAGTESDFNPNAVSPAGAGGVMQIMPGTAKDLGVTNRFDVGQSINKGTAYLKQQMDKFGNLDHALAAYNWGPGNAEKWVAGGADPAKLPAETRNYIAKVKAKLQGQTAQAGPGVPQGDSPQADASGNALPPAQQALAPLRGLQIPPGARVALQGGVPIVKDGNVLYLDANGGWGAAPLPSRKEPGADKGLFGDSLTGRALTALRTLTPDTQDYAAAYAILSKPQVISDGAGGQQVIQPMDLSMFPKPAFGGGGQPVGSGAPVPAGVTPPGGPQPTQIPGGGTVTNIPGKGKPLDNSARDDLKKIADTALELPMLLQSFDPSFGGYMYGAAGDAANFAKRNLPDALGGADPKGQAQWWQRYNNFANLERNKLFGSALTPGETAAFNAAMVNTGMKPDQIKANLERQSEIAQKALSRIANALKSSGYNAEAIEALTGTPFASMPSPTGAVPQAPPKAGSAEQGRDEFNASKAPIKVKTPEEASKLPPGTVFETPDGRIKVRP